MATKMTDVGLFAFLLTVTLITLSEGELVITSLNVARGYLNLTSTSHAPSTDVEGATVFRTGNIYELRPIPEGGSVRALRWVGRCADYIQLVSGELLDPWEPKRSLAESPYIARIAHSH